MELFSVSVLAPCWLIVPVTFTVPPVLLQVPMPPVALNVPPRFTVAAFTLIVPALVQVPVGAMVRMPPLLASSVPVAPLAKLVAGLMVRVRPLTCEEISPLFVSAMAAL